MEIVLLDPESLREGIDDDGTINDLEIETYYAEVKELRMSDSGSFVRVIGDCDMVDTEIRIPLTALKAFLSGEGLT